MVSENGILVRSPGLTVMSRLTRLGSISVIVPALYILIPFSRPDADAHRKLGNGSPVTGSQIGECKDDIHATKMVVASVLSRRRRKRRKLDRNRERGHFQVIILRRSLTFSLLYLLGREIRPVQPLPWFPTIRGANS